MTKDDKDYHRKRGAEIVAQIQAARKKHEEDMDDKAEAFEDWWNGDEDDEPITDISKDRAAEIFFDGYEMGSRKPIYMMTESQQKLLMRMMGDKVKAEERKRIIDMLLDMHAKEERHNYYGFIARLIKESA